MYIKDVKSWGYSEKIIARMCREGIIPLAEKEGWQKKWSIPDGQTKPPFSTWKKYVFLMHCIELVHDEELDVTKSNWGGISVDQVREGYKYLIDNLFIKPFDVDNLEDIKNSGVTSDGKNAIEYYNNRNKENKKKYKNSSKKIKANVEAEGNIGVAKIKGGIEYEHSTEE